jgi:translation initiation factor IF-2
MILLVADLEELKADTDVPAEGLVIEAHMEKGRGPVVSLLVENGFIKPGAHIAAGGVNGKIRTLLDFMGKPLKEAGPSTPVTVTGFKELPEFGDRFTIMVNEKAVRSASESYRLSYKKEESRGAVSSAELLNIMTRRKEKQLVNIEVKADVQGSLTSVLDSLRLLENDELALRVISSGVGNITENDIRMAASSNGIIYGFNVQLPPAVKQLANREKVSVRIFKVIYELLDDARAVLTELLAPEVVETEIGKLVVRGVFRTMKDEVICGGEVTIGKVEQKLLVSVLRNKEKIAYVEVKDVKIEQQEVKEILSPVNDGLQLKTHGRLLIEEGDRLEFFRRELVKRSL